MASTSGIMMKRTFDRKFGPQSLLQIPNSAGVYRFYDDSNSVIYVGKAKNLRRRLSQYRNARRLKAHRRMNQIVREASRVEFEVCQNEKEALLLENRLIQELKPKWNISGAYSFLYPFIGFSAQSD